MRDTQVKQGASLLVAAARGERFAEADGDVDRDVGNAGVGR
jgi:hypothetical protein